MLGIGNKKREESSGNNAKKNTPCYIERDEDEREAFAETLESLPEDAELYYADESGFEEYYTRNYGYSQRGERVYAEVSGNRYGRTIIVGATDKNNEFTAGFAFKGYMNGALFTGWLEHIFASSLKKPEKSILIIDNASHHPKDEIYDIAEEYGFRVIFLPKYSPDLNPIEKFWAKIKNWLRLHMKEFGSFWEGLVRAFG